MSLLAGKTALVTGGARGIGAAIARRLAADGAAVALTFSASMADGQKVVSDIRASGGRAMAIRADAGNPAEAKGAVAQTFGEYGALDILVNNAGILSLGEIVSFADAAFERALSVNVRAVYYASRAAAEVMGDNGRIINIGSVNAHCMPFQGGSVYALTKAALGGFTRGLARDLGPRGITVNTIEPGPVDTDMNPEHGAMSESLRAMIALKRYGRPEEIAGLVAFLAGPEGAFITGASLPADGGFDA